MGPSLLWRRRASTAFGRSWALVSDMEESAARRSSAKKPAIRACAAFLAACIWVRGRETRAQQVRTRAQRVKCGVGRPAHNKGETHAHQGETHAQQVVRGRETPQSVRIRAY